MFTDIAQIVGRVRDVRGPGVRTACTVTCAIVVALAGCRRDEVREPTSKPGSTTAHTVTLEGREIPVSQGAAPGYVPDDTCAACHPDIAASFKHVGMGKAFYAPSSDNIIEDFENNHFYHPLSDRHYVMIHDDGEFRLKRYQLDDEGRPINVIEQRIDWVMGSGNHARSYLYGNTQGELFQLPLAWYSQRGGRWGMAPGFDKKEHYGFNRPIPRDCMFCHNSYPELPEGADRVGQPHRYPAELPEGLGCQRCHGPGAEHVRLADDLESTLGDVRASIVNPARLAPELREDVCMQCHLQPDSGIASIVRTFGRGDFSYKPGEPLSDFILHFDSAQRPPEERFEINHHPFRLAMSRCYTASDGQMNCMTCHDPHRKVPPDEAVAFYSAKCITCHQPTDCDIESMRAGGGDDPRPDTPADDCVTCHMAMRIPEDVVLAVMTDHYIQRRPVSIDDIPELHEHHGAHHPERVAYSLPGREAHGQRDEFYRGVSMVRNHHAEGLDIVSRVMEESEPESVEPYLVLATEQVRSGQPVEAIKNLQRVIRVQPDSVQAQTNLGNAYFAIGREEEAERHFKEAIRLAPDFRDGHYNYGVALAAWGRTEEAATAFREAIRLKPNDDSSLLNLGNAYAGMGQFEKAAETYFQTLRHEPNKTDAYQYIGSVLFRLNRAQDALRYWRHGARVAPDAGPIQRALAMTYLLSAPQQRDVGLGLHYAESAAQSLPDDPRSAMLYGIALFMSERFDEALAAAERACERGADHANCALLVALAHDARGDSDALVTALVQTRESRNARPRPAPDPIGEFLRNTAENTISQRSAPSEG